MAAGHGGGSGAGRGQRGGRAAASTAGSRNSRRGRVPASQPAAHMPTLSFRVPSRMRSTSSSATPSSTSTSFTAVGGRQGEHGSGGRGTARRSGRWLGWPAGAGLQGVLSPAGARNRQACRAHRRNRQRATGQAGSGQGGQGRTGAALAAVREGALDAVRGGGGDVGVGAHDGRVLSSQLHLQCSGEGAAGAAVRGAGAAEAAGRVGGRSPEGGNRVRGPANPAEAQRQPRRSPAAAEHSSGHSSHTPAPPGWAPCPPCAQCRCRCRRR